MLNQLNLIMSRKLHFTLIYVLVEHRHDSPLPLHHHLAEFYTSSNDFIVGLLGNWSFTKFLTRKIRPSLQKYRGKNLNKKRFAGTIKFVPKMEQSDCRHKGNISHTRSTFGKWRHKMGAAREVGNGRKWRATDVHGRQVHLYLVGWDGKRRRRRLKG